jgi:hypothetical protein
MCMYVCMNVCVHVCMYACMYVCMHACMYVLQEDAQNTIAVRCKGCHFDHCQLVTLTCVCVCVCTAGGRAEHDCGALQGGAI